MFLQHAVSRNGRCYHEVMEKKCGKKITKREEEEQSKKMREKNKKMMKRRKRKY